MSEPEQFDAIGVTLSLDKRSRFNAKRIYIRDNKIVKSEDLTLGRVASAATQEAAWSLERIVKEWMRGLVGLEQPTTPKFTYSEDK